MAAIASKAVKALSGLLISEASKEDKSESKRTPAIEAPAASPSMPPPGRPVLERLPSQAMSMSSEDSSVPEGPNVEFQAPTPIDAPKGDFGFGRTSTVETDKLSAQLAATLTSEPVSASPRPTSPLSAEVGRSPSASSPSTVDGYQRHRRSWSINAPREVIETPDAKTTEELETGVRTLNQYRIGEQLGKGSYGCVWLATDVNTGAEYAVKEFSKSRLRRQAAFATMRANRRKGTSARTSPLPSPGETPTSRQASPSWRPRASSTDGIQLIRSEVAIMKKLRHVNIVSLVEVLDEADTDSLYMILELCKGGPIMQVTVTEDAEPMSEDVARGYFRQVLLALEYLHHIDICHHDVKPDNILLMSRGSDEGDLIKLVDFGVSQLFAKDGEDLSAKTVGSPAFLSPELHISHHGQLHQRASDIWSFGVTLFSLLTGHLPFRSTNSLELAEMIKSEPAAIPKALSPEARDLLSQMLDKNSDARIDIAGIRAHPWTTDKGQIPLPSVEANVAPFEEPTQADVDDAFRSLSSAASAVRIAQRLRRLAASRRSISHSGSSGAATSDASSIATPPSSASSANPPKADLPVVRAHDDVNVETIRRYEDTTGEMLERSETIVRASRSRTLSGDETPPKSAPASR